MKRLLAWMLGLMLLLSGTALAENASDDTLVVGSTTRLSGDFFAGLWSANTADIDVRTLLHDAATVAFQENGHYAINENVVLETGATEVQGSGDHTYTFQLREDLRFSDGSAITAKDYVFAVLLLSSPQLKALGAANTGYAHLRGWDDFAAGTGAFAGVRLLSQDSFSLTIAGEQLPYFYELSMVQVTPYPLAVLAPGCDIRDDGKGAFLTGDFSQALLEKTVLNAETGYLTHPGVVSGAYTLTGYDPATGTAEFAANPYYMGNSQGQKPAIEKLIFKQVHNDTVMAELENGTVDLVNKISSGDVIEAGRAKLEAGELGAGSYLRSGLSFVAFACEEGPAASLALRKAVALSIDSQALCDSFLKGYGIPAYGYYGYGQWMAAQQMDALLNLDLYERDLNAALDLLLQGGWRYDATGADYAPGSGQARYRALGADGLPTADAKTAARYEALQLKMAVPRNNAAARAVVDQLQTSFAQLGVGLEVTELPMDVLLRHYYRQTERTYDLFFLATNFSFIFDPYYTYNTADAYQGLFNTSGLRDEQLMLLAQELRQVSPEDAEGYKAKWLEFQAYWVGVLPLAPLYSNVYFDFYRADLLNYNIAAYSSWASAILYATWGEAAAE